MFIIVYKIIFGYQKYTKLKDINRSIHTIYES